MLSAPISRRALLAAAAFSTACQRPRATGILGYCLVANRDSRSLSVIDLTHFRPRTRIDLDSAPTEIVAAGTQARAYVLSQANGTVYEIDGLKLAIARRVKLGNAAVTMRVARSGDALWVLMRDPAAIVELPLASMKPSRQIRLAAPADAFELARETDDACAIASTAKTIAIASLTQGTIARTIDAATEPSVACFRRDGKHLIVGSERDRSVTIYDTPTGRTVVKLPLAIGPRNFCTSDDGGQLYITGDGMDAVVTVYPYRTEVAETRLAGHAPGAMAITETSPASYLMVANPSDDRVTVLDVDTGKLAALVEVGKNPGQIVITPDRQYALVLNEGSGDVSVVRIFSLGGNQTGGARVKRYKSAPVFTMVPVGERPVSAAVVVLG